MGHCGFFPLLEALERPVEGEITLSTAFRTGLLSASVPTSQRTHLFDEMQRAFAFLRDGLRPTYDPKDLVDACGVLPMSFGARPPLGGNYW